MFLGASMEGGGEGEEEGEERKKYLIMEWCFYLFLMSFASDI